MACATPPEDPSIGPPPGRPDEAPALDSQTLPSDRGDTRLGVESAQEAEIAPDPHRLFRINPGLAPGLYVVSTPIGNLRDITLRALDVLASADIVCAEDTRVTGKLLSAYGVSARLRPYHDHNGAEVRPGLLAQLEKGARIVLMSDAGTPLVSDPGYKLVREAVERGLPVIAVPGASAPLTALAAAGLPTDRFMFAGFPPPKSGARRRMLEELKAVRTTLVFFEGPSRLVESLADMAAVLGDREAAVARELTKKFEEIRRGRLISLAEHYAVAGPPRGEIVVLVGPPAEAEELEEGALDAAIAAADTSRPLKEVSAEIAARFGLKRRDVYERALTLRDGDD
jgi:16S rRNA (cytidine1402-2'-O)-methyltransferase